MAYFCKYRTQLGKITTKLPHKMRIGLLLLNLIIISSNASTTQASVFPSFKCFTDKENELLVGEVKTVILYRNDKRISEICFNEHGNFTTITGSFSKIYPYQINRYSCEGYYVNNLYHRFFEYRLSESHILLPFWLIGMWWDYKLSFCYDENDRLISIGTSEYNNIKKDHYDFIYDEKGRLITRKCNGLPTMKLRWSENNLIGYYLYKEDGSSKYNGEMTINGNRIIIKERHGQSCIETNNEGKIISYAAGNELRYYFKAYYYYDSNGLIKKAIISSSPGVEDITTFKYDTHMNLLDYERRIKNKGEISIIDHYCYVYTYDNVGNWVSKITYSIKKGDIEVRHKICTETREITYFDNMVSSNN